MATPEDEERKKRIKDTKARLALETDIAKITDRSRKSLKDYASVRGQIRDIDKEIADLNQLIFELQDDASDADIQKLQTLEQTSKELKKELSLRKSIGRELATKTVGALSRQTQLLKGSLSMFYDIDDSVRKTSMSLGLSAGRMDTLSTNAQGVANHFASIGLSSTDALAGQMAFSEEVGRTVMLSQQAMINMGELAKKTGMSTSEIGGMVGQMEAFGFGSVSAMKQIEGIRDTAQGMGVNSGKVIKKVQQNMGLLNKLNFKGGVKGLGKMAAYSEKFKVNMEDIASSAKAVWSPEGAIEAASSLQILGGGFSKLADPFKLMFDARNDPQKYAEGIINSLEGIAVFDGKDSFGVSAYEMQRLEEAGKALGFSGEKMKEMAIQKAKMDKMEGSIMGDFSKEEKAMLTGMMEFKDGKAIIDGKSLKSMEEADLKKILAHEAMSELEAKNAISAREQWEGIKNQMLSTFLPLMKELDPMIRDLTQFLSKFIKESPVWAASIAGIGMAIGKLAEWRIKGYHMGLGFNSATKKGGLLTRAKNMLGAGKKVAPPTMGPSTPAGYGGGGVDGVKGNAGKVGKSGKSGSSLESLAKGLTAMGTPQVLFGAANLIPAAIGLIAMLPATITMGLLTAIKGKKLSKSLSGLGTGLSKMGTPQVAFGALNLLLAGTAFLMMTAGIVGFAIVAGLGGFMSGALSGLAVGLTAMGTPQVILGALALMMVGAAFMMLGAGILFLGMGIAMIVDSFANLFSVVNSDNIGALLMLGPALMGISLGIMMLGGSLLFLAATMAMGGWLGLLALGVAAESVGTAFKGIDANGITQSVDAINNVDMDKINALKELSTAMAVWGMFGSKPIVVQMEVGGEIKMGGSNGESFDISELSPAQISELKDLLFQKQKVDSTGGLY